VKHATPPLLQLSQKRLPESTGSDLEARRNRPQERAVPLNTSHTRETRLLCLPELARAAGHTPTQQSLGTPGSL